MRSPWIGPLIDPSSFSFALSSVESTDSTLIRLYGLDSLGQRSLLLSDESSNNTIALDTLNLESFSHLQIEYFAQDSIKRDPPQLEYWRVIDAPNAEVAVAPNLFFSAPKDTINELETSYVELAIKNIGDKDLDSLQVNLTLTDEQSQTTQLEKWIYNFTQKDTAHIQFDLSNLSQIGSTKGTIEINPTRSITEEHYFNNTLFFDFYVDSDKTPPFLQVFFDGSPILNREIVSPQPTILIELEDDNSFALLEDTSLFEILLEYPDGREQNIYLNAEDVLFSPSSQLENNRATIEFTPTLSEDGIYALYVNAKDNSGNPSGNLNQQSNPLEQGYQYKIEFEVINKAALSNFLNYPNPFTDKTHFVYTLTGSEIPSYFQIQIMTVSGKLVKTIQQAELGPLKAGVNQTEYSWDGRDDFGDPLATGVYLYRVIAKKSNGESFDIHPSGADAYISNGIGKMVIIK